MNIIKKESSKLVKKCCLYKLLIFCSKTLNKLGSFSILHLFWHLSLINLSGLELNFTKKTIVNFFITLYKIVLVKK